jgi:hypothetical protein
MRISKKKKIIHVQFREPELTLTRKKQTTTKLQELAHNSQYPECKWS